MYVADKVQYGAKLGVYLFMSSKIDDSHQKYSNVDLFWKTDYRAQCLADRTSTGVLIVGLKVRWQADGFREVWPVVFAFESSPAFEL